MLKWEYKTFTLDELLPNLDKEQEIIELASKEIKKQLDKKCGECEVVGNLIDGVKNENN